MVYQGTILWERNPLPTIQNYTAASCPITRTKVRDARDDATYWIRKIPNTKAGGGDLCWMETNLAYAGGGDNTYGDTIPTGFTTSTLNVVSATALSGQNDDGSCYYDYSRPCVYTAVPGSTRTTGFTSPSTNTTGIGQYGYLYNWCAAMGGQPSACQTATATQPNQSVNGGTSATQYNICPKGWRLPTGGSGREFTNLNVAINGGSTSDVSGLRVAGLFMNSGRWNNGQFYYQGYNGYYWSSTTTVNGEFSFALGYDAGGIYPDGSNGRRGSLAVRCVAP